MSGTAAAVRRALNDAPPLTGPPPRTGALPQGGGARQGGRADRARRRCAHQVRRARGTLLLVAALAAAAPAAAFLVPGSSGAAPPPGRQGADLGPGQVAAPAAADPGPPRTAVTGPLLLPQDLDAVFPGARVLQDLYAGPLVTLPGDRATSSDGSALRGWCGDVPVTGGGAPLTAWAGAWTDAPPGAAAPPFVRAASRTGLGPGTVLQVVSRFTDASAAQAAVAATVTSATACRGRRAGEVWQVQGQPSADLAVAVAPWGGEAVWAVRTTSVRGSLEVSVLCVVGAPGAAAAAEAVRPVAEAAVARAASLPDGA